MVLRSRKLKRPIDHESCKCSEFTDALAFDRATRKDYNRRTLCITVGDNGRNLVQVALPWMEILKLQGTTGVASILLCFQVILSLFVWQNLCVSILWRLDFVCHTTWALFGPTRWPCTFGFTNLYRWVWGPSPSRVGFQRIWCSRCLSLVDLGGPITMSHTYPKDSQTKVYEQIWYQNEHMYSMTNIISTILPQLLQRLSLSSMISLDKQKYPKRSLELQAVPQGNTSHITPRN